MTAPRPDHRAMMKPEPRHFQILYLSLKKLVEHFHQATEKPMAEMTVKELLQWARREAEHEKAGKR